MAAERLGWVILVTSNQSRNSTKLVALLLLSFGFSSKSAPISLYNHFGSSIASKSIEVSRNIVQGPEKKNRALNPVSCLGSVASSNF